MMTDTSLSGTVSLVMGASVGLGAAIAEALAARGAAVALAARRRDAVDALAAKITAAGGQALPLTCDVSDPAAVKSAVAATIARFGKLDHLINNAGVIDPIGRFLDTDPAAWVRLMDINLNGAMYACHAALPHLKASRGRLVAVSSLAGLVGVPGRTAYSASKFAMTGFFEALRAELVVSGVSVTTAYPGVVATQIRYRGWNAQGRPAGSSGLKEDKAMSVEACAALIVQGMHRREREVVMSAQGKIGRFLKLLAPGLVEKMAMAALKDEVKPH
jgi:NAD(P)-dependent dehydrogenase (short-subunit alcohol dehydrogenase family)